MSKRRLKAAVEHGWDWAHAALWSDVPENGHRPRCSAQMVDTVIFYRDGGVVDASLWLFTSKNGTVARKKTPKTASRNRGGAVPAAKIRDRFTQLASRYSSASLQQTKSEHGSGYVAIVVAQDGSRRLVEPAELEECLQTLENEGSAASKASNTLKSFSDSTNVVKGLQAYIPSQGDEPNHIYVAYEAGVGSSMPVVTVERRSGHFHVKDGGAKQGSLITLAPALRSQTEDATASVVNFLARASDARVVSAALEFVVDESQTLWLTHIERVELHPHDGVAGGISSKLSQKQASLPNLLSPSLFTTDSSHPVDKCRGEFCQTALASLPGLAKVVQHLPTGDNNSNSLEDTAGDHDGKTELVVLEDTGQRFKMGNNNVLLAHAELDFLRGTAIPVAVRLDASALALQWQEADNVFRMELGRANPSLFYKQVPVCANCHRIYSELNRARDLGFCRPRTASLPTEIVASTASSARNDHRGPPIDQPSDAYDQLFLEELAKQTANMTESTQEPLSARDSRSSRKSPSRGPEQDERPTSASSSATLPSLQPAGSSIVKHKRKSGNSSSRNGTPRTAVGASSNQQPAIGSTHTLADGTKLLERVASLETELAQTKQKLAAADARKRKLEDEMVRTRTQCSTMLQEKEEQSRKQLLELEYSFHSRESKAKLAQSGKSGDSSASDEMAAMIETIDSLNLQLDQSNAQAEQAKRELVRTHQAELKRLHEKYQLDMETLRLSEHTAKEQAEELQMQTLSLQSQTQVATTQAKHAKAALEDLTANKLAVLEEKNQRLERQIAALKTQHRNLAASGGTASLVSASSARAQDMEALEKHLGNKVDYLKAQLASEMKCREELGSHLAQVTSAMENMKKDKRQALADQEEAFKKQTERLEAAFAQEKQELSTQQASMQGKLVTLQANVTDLVQELTMWKSKEANAKLAMDKLAEENVRLTRQLVDAEAQVESLEEERKLDTASTGSMGVKSANEETKRMQMEALLRRLDNERQYLKSQLEGQQEMKDRSQQQVADLQHELQQLKDEMEEALRLAEQKLSALAMEKRNQEQELRGSVACLEESKLLLQRQLKEVQAKFTQTREQALLERDEVDKMRVEVGELRAQLLAAREDSVKEQQYAKAAGERTSKSLAAVKKSLQAMEQEKNRCIQYLEDENAMYMGKLATAQGEMLVLEEKRLAESARVKKERAITVLATVLGEKVALWRLRMQYHAFSSVKVHYKLVGMQMTMTQQREEALDALEERLKEDYMAKCDDMAQTLHDERLAAISTMKETHDKDREELHAFYEQEKAQLEEELTAAHATQRQQLEKQHAELAASAETSATNRIQTLQCQIDELQQDNHRLTEEVSELVHKSERMACAFEDDLGALRTEWSRQQEVWTSDKTELQRELVEQRDEFSVKLQTATRELQETHDREFQHLKASHAAELREREVQANAQLAMFTEEYNQRHAAVLATELEAVGQQHQQQFEETTTLVNARWQQELERLQATHAQQLKETQAAAERKNQLQLDALQQDMNTRKGSAVVQCTSKWQRAMEELQERLEADKRSAYEDGVRDREAQWQQAAQQIKDKQKQELDAVQQEALAAIRAAEQRHELRFQAELQQLKARLEAEHRHKLETLANEIEQRERERAQEQQDTSAQALEQELTQQHALALEQQAKTLETTFQTEKTRLVAAFEEQRDAALQQQRQWHEEELQQLEKEWHDKLQALETSTAAEHEREAARVRQEMAEQLNASKEELETQFAQQLAQELEKQEVKLVREQEEAVAQVQDDSEKLIAQVEHAMEELKRQKELLETELQALRTALEEAEDAQFDTQESAKLQQQHAAFRLMQFVVRARKTLEDRAHMATTERQELEDKRGQVQRELEEEQQQRERQTQRVRDAWTTLKRQHDEMHETLTQYKREELVAHRSSSAVLSNELSIVAKQLAEVEDMKAVLERDTDALQTEAQAVEASLRDLMLQSGTGSGSQSLNMAVVAKKRRLNEEFEALLERIEKKKAEIRSVDQTLGALRVRREDKQQEMRAMERKLVEILVQQQKRMVALVATAREQPPPSDVFEDERAR